MTEERPHLGDYAVIHVSPGPGLDAWPVVQRVPGGWQSGVHHYPDEEVLDVQKLAAPPVPAVPADDQATVERMARAIAVVTYGQPWGHLSESSHQHCHNQARAALAAMREQCDAWA